jgi:16S rRNA G966 N2-methylase RsmD
MIKNKTIAYQKLFPTLSDHNYKKLKIDYDFASLMTPYPISKEISELIIFSLNNITIDRINPDEWNSIDAKEKASELVITDMTAGVGGNILSFCEVFNYVNAIELNSTHYDYLVNNIKLYHYKNANTYFGNSIDFVINYGHLKQDIVFIDPPWGGQSYSDHASLHLKLGDYTMDELVNKLLNDKLCKMVVLKLPINYNQVEFCNNVKYKTSIHQLKKMLIFIITDNLC